MNTATPLHIDMVSDIVCPWCIIGYQRLQAALTKLREAKPELDITLSFQPFELNPRMPAEGQNVNEHIAEKYGSDIATIQNNRQQLKALGLAEGVRFEGDENSIIVNTFLAHKLLHKAEELGTQEALKQALFKAYFEAREDISQVEVLLKIATNNGFSAELAQSVLDNKDIEDQVRASQQQYIDMGISSVPTFIFNKQYSVSGAQDADTLVGVMQDILSKGN